jgi:hypothetical protein
LGRFFPIYGKIKNVPNHQSNGMSQNVGSLVNPKIDKKELRFMDVHPPNIRIQVLIHPHIM